MPLNRKILEGVVVVVCVGIVDLFVKFVLFFVVLWCTWLTEKSHRELLW